MSKISKHQEFKLRRLFDRICTLDGEIDGDDLSETSAHFGLFIPPEDVVKKMVEFTSRPGSTTLNFNDFLCFIENYQDKWLRVSKKSLFSLQYFKEVMNVSGFASKDLERILSIGPNRLHKADIEYIVSEIFPSVVNESTTSMLRPTELSPAEICESLLDSTVEMPSINPPPIENLVQNFVITISHATNLDGSLRIKKSPNFLAYRSIDPMVSVSREGKVKDTTILINQTLPEWSEDILMELKIPTTDTYIVQRWFEANYLILNLYDYIVGGVVPHTELIASNFINLASAIKETGNRTIITLDSPYVQHPKHKKIQLQIDVRVPGDLATLPYHFKRPDEIWVSKFGKKLELDLNRGFISNFQRITISKLHIETSESNNTLHSLVDSEGKKNDSEVHSLTSKESDHSIVDVSNSSSTHRIKRTYSEAVVEKEKGFFHYYLSFVKIHFSNFKRRNFQLVAIDEYNTFRLLNSYITPIYDDSDMNVFDLANNVARISCRSTFIPLPPSPSGYQIQSSSLLLFNQNGSKLDLCLFLCGLFIAKGLDAYVCIGQTHGETVYWVTTFGEKKGKENSNSIYVRGSSRDIFLRSTFSDDNKDLSDSSEGGDDLGTFHEDGEGADNGEEEYSNPSLIKQKIVNDLILKQIKSSTYHWNPINGQYFSDDETNSPSFPFNQLDTIFNDKNIYLNAQPMSEVYKCDWDFDDDDNWIPFLTKQTQNVFGVVANAFDPPILQMKPATYIDERTTLDLVGDLVNAIGNYRRNSCLISNTRFHRHISKYLQGQLPSMERALNSKEKNWDILDEIENTIMLMLPPHHIWYGKAIRSGTTLLGEVMQQLESTGILDCSIPETMYSIGVYVTTYEWGLQSVWIYLGYMYDEANVISNSGM